MAVLNGFLQRITRQTLCLAENGGVTRRGIALSDGQKRWLTGDPMRHFVHELRSRWTLLTGVGTILADDPELTCRALPGL